MQHYVAHKDTPEMRVDDDEVLTVIYKATGKQLRAEFEPADLADSDYRIVFRAEPQAPPAGHVIEYGYEPDGPGAIQQTISFVPMPLEQFRAQKLQQLMQHWEQIKSELVEHDSIMWRGGFESALAIKGVIDLAEDAEETNVTLYDAAGNPHQYTTTTARAVAVAVGGEYQQKYGQLAGLRVAISNAGSIPALTNINW